LACCADIFGDAEIYRKTEENKLTTSKRIKPQIMSAQDKNTSI